MSNIERPNTQQPKLHYPRLEPSSLGIHASKSAPDTEAPEHGPRRASDTQQPRHRRTSSTSGIRRKLNGLFRRASHSSHSSTSPSQSRQASGSHNPKASRTSSNESNYECYESQLHTPELMHESLAKLEHSSFLASDSSSDIHCAESSHSLPDDRPSMRSASTFTAQYRADPAPGMWDTKKQQQQQPAGRPNMPLEPEEYATDTNMPWIIDQMNMGEQPFSSLFTNEIGYINVGDGDGGSNQQRHTDRKHRRKYAFGVLKTRVGEARIGVQKDMPTPSVDAFRRPDGTTDYLDFACRRIKHYADTQLSHKLDFRHSSDDPCKLDRFLITLQRLVEVSAPYQRFVVWLYQLARWDNPKLTLWWCFVYFFLLYQGMISMFLWLTPAFIVVYHRLRPSQAYLWLGFERPETSIIPSKIVQDASSGTIAKGLIANRMWDIWRETLGAHLHLVLADLADWMERAKNCATWKRPWASRTVIAVLTFAGLFAYLIPAAVFQKLFGLCMGVQFFFLAPLQLRHQRYRRMLWIIDIILWHCPNDVELSLDTLYMESRGYVYRGPSSYMEYGASLFSRIKARLVLLVADLLYAYNPFAKERRPPVMVLQTASSTALDHMDEEGAENSSLYDAFIAGKQLGKQMLGDAGAFESRGEEHYTGLGAESGMQFPSVMGEHEEREWLKQSGMAPRTTHTFSTDTLDGESLIADSVISQLAESQPSLVDELGNFTVRKSSSGNSSNSTSPRRRSYLMSKAKDLSSRVLRRKSHQNNPSDVSRRPSQKGPMLHRQALASAADIEDELERRRRMRLSLDLHDVDLSKLSLQQLGVHRSNCSGDNAEAMLPNTPDTGNARASLDTNAILKSPVSNAADSNKSESLELMHEANQLQSLRNKDARATKDGIDLSSLYAFRCIHQGKYGTLFVTSDRFIFRRSRIMGGRRSSVSSFLLSNVVAIRKSASGLGKAHGIQLLLNDGKSHSFFGLSNRNDVFGFLLLRCGNRHLY
ncbi:hypothetical protein LPJ78_003112 [Coemansia sp. RSA 989]|nr:hypothetical protein LPJ79_003132 [Coemansia sp. RSA 1821]KAJ1864841.1 hypothetical protein LPJ78_003112 [Coemansia sp. RSA 989]KAJ1871199.1 hypothetical protein LPJ55_004077 [Coemansia sp. RSA 990]KAJ2669344.1 hypothetical protein IWW42_004641 [Coemansia sp. RSA 1085]